MELTWCTDDKVNYFRVTWCNCLKTDLVAQKQLIVEQNGKNFGPPDMWNVHRYIR